MEKGQGPEKQEGNHGSEEKYSFLQEKIKEKPVNWKKVGYKALFVAGAGLIFGLCVCMGFYGLKPWAEEHFTDHTQTVTIPKDNSDMVEDDAAKEDEEEPKQAALTIDNYRELNRALYDVAREASKSVVEVSSHDADEAWLEAEAAKEAAGLLVGDGGTSVLILTKSSKIQGDNPVINVTFPDDSTYEGSLVARDRNLDLAVVAVGKSQLSETVWAHTQYATLGNSNIVGRGDMVIALGSPFGSYGGMAYGILSTVKDQITLADGTFKILSCDIGGAVNSSGILVNLKGEVIGILREGEEKDSLLTAYPISDIRDQIDKLLNQTAVPYLGIIGTDIPDEVKLQKKLSEGIYVKEVEADSPAMQAGIQSGDVIVSIDGTEINTMSAYKNKLLTYKQGDHLKIKGKREGADGYVDVNYEAVVGSKG